MSRSLETLNSEDVRAWCEEWAIPAYMVECALVSYVCEETHVVVSRLARMARSQQKRLMENGKLFSPEDFLENPALLSNDPEPDWNAPSEAMLRNLKELIKRFVKAEE